MFKIILIAASLFFMSMMSIASTAINNLSKENHLENVYKKESFKPIGNTLFSILFWDLYKSKLLTTSGTYPIDNQQDKLLYEIEYLQGISSNDLIGRTIDEWVHLGISPTVYQEYVPKLKEIWPDIKPGDSLSMLMDGEGTAFYYNQSYVGGIESAEFGPLFLNIWLAENTSQPDLRDELLGGLND